MGNPLSKQRTLASIWSCSHREIIKALQSYSVTPLYAVEHDPTLLAQYYARQGLMSESDRLWVQMPHFPLAMQHSLTYEQSLTELRKPFATSLWRLWTAFTIVPRVAHDTAMAMYTIHRPSGSIAFDEAGTNTHRKLYNLVSVHVKVDREQRDVHEGEIRRSIGTALKTIPNLSGQMLLPAVMEHVGKQAWLAYLRLELKPPSSEKDEKIDINAGPDLNPITLIRELLEPDLSRMALIPKVYYLLGIYDMLALLSTQQELYIQWEAKVAACQCEAYFLGLSTKTLPSEAACLNDYLEPRELGLLIAQYLARPPTRAEVLTRLLI